MAKHDSEHLGLDYTRHGLHQNLEFKARADAAGYWFAAAVLFAFLAAGIIVYRAGGDEFQTAANEGPLSKPLTSQINPQPLLKPQ